MGEDGGLQRDRLLDKSSDARRFAKLWLFESSTYNFSINISMGLANAFVIRTLGFGLIELGFLTALRMLAIMISQPFAALLLLLHRGWRKSLWFVGGGLNRVLWALIPLSLKLPNALRLPYISTIIFTAQFMGGIGGVAAMDCIGSNIPSGEATRVFSAVNKYSYVSIALSQLAGIAVFLLGLEVATGYTALYVVALSVAVVSTTLLYVIPDYVAKRSDLTSNVRVNPLILVENVELRRYLVIVSLFNFSVNIPAPFWDYIVLNVTGELDIFIPVKNVVNLLVKYVVIDWWQRLSFKHGLRKILIEGMAFTSLVPVLYLEASSATEIVVAETVSGFVWAPVDIGFSVYTTYLPPDSVRPIYLSTINLIVNGATTLATAAGTALAAWTSNVYSTLVASATMRIVTAGLAYKLVPQLEAAKLVGSGERN